MTTQNLNDLSTLRDAILQDLDDAKHMSGLLFEATVSRADSVHWGCGLIETKLASLETRINQMFAEIRNRPAG